MHRARGTIVGKRRRLAFITEGEINMLISEVKGWHYFISWDNPVPENSSAMLQSLGELGKLSTLQTKTSVALAPYSTTHWQQVRDAIKTHLHPEKGNAFYVNLRSGKGFQVGPRTKWHWKSAPSGKRK